MPLPQENGPWNFYRLGPAKEKELFKRHRQTYSGVAISAHLASYYQKFCLEFVGSLQKPYFIDPVTHIFAANPASLRRFVKDKDTKRTKRDQVGNKMKGAIKRSFQKIIDAYGPVIQRVVDETRCIEPDDFKDGELLDFVERVCRFQTETLCELPKQYKKYEKYAARAGQLEVGKKNHPAFLIPPYFPIKSASWITLNTKMAEMAKSFAQGLPVFPVVAGKLEVLTHYKDGILKRLESVGANGVFVWADGFSGYQSATDVKLFRELVRSLADVGLSVLNLYGDAMSLPMSYHGLKGFSCGICYGEKRQCDQDMDVEGMIPPFYYVSLLKKKYQLETDLRRINLSQWKELLCDCSICAATQALWDLNDTQVREHFMLSRARELDEIRRGLLAEQMRTRFAEAYDSYRNIAPFSPLSHLAVWSRTL